jgi:rhamnulokinase
MRTHHFLAFDFGASSGRAILGSLGESLKLREVHRFTNRPVHEDGHMRWNTDGFEKALHHGLARGIEKANGLLEGVGIDTWGVDFGLLDDQGRLLEKPVCYRDERTDGMMEKVFEKMPAEDIYEITGIQFMQLNTLFQVYSLIHSQDPVVKRVHALLFMPDLLTWMLTRNLQSEYTIASTSQLLDAGKKRWAGPIFERLGIPIKWMQAVIKPGNPAGSVNEFSAMKTGPDIPVYLPACHDTACAVAAVPAAGDTQDWAYLSSGTWSLLGIEVKEPVISEGSFKENFTNEGGVEGRIRFLRNVMGLWLLERSMDGWRKDAPVSYEVIQREAVESPPFIAVVDPDDGCFLNPENMIAAIQDYCRKTGQAVPENRGCIVRVILESLALKYRFVLDKIVELSGRRIDRIHVVGGGCQNSLLNQFTADATAKEVIAGPVEATAAGNILVQAIGAGMIAGLKEARRITADSFELRAFFPRESYLWEKKYQEVKHRFS